MRAHRLRHRDAEQPDRPRPGDDDALAGDEPAQFGEPVHRGARRHHQRRLLVRHRVRNGDQRVDVVDLVFAEAAVGGEAVGAVALVDVAVIEPVVVARRVHALAAALALAAAGVDFDGDALADLVFVDAGAERRDRAHIFVAGGEILVERHAAQDRGRRAVIDDLQVGGADRHRIDAHQHLGALGHRHRLFRQLEFAGVAQHPGPHRVGDRYILARLYAGAAIHGFSFGLVRPPLAALIMKFPPRRNWGDLPLPAVRGEGRGEGASTLPEPCSVSCDASASFLTLRIAERPPHPPAFATLRRIDLSPHAGRGVGKPLPFSRCAFFAPRGLSTPFPKHRPKRHRIATFVRAFRRGSSEWPTIATVHERTDGRKKQQGSRTPTDASSKAAPAGAARTLRGALACRRSTAALARETAGPQGSASGHAFRDGPERSILYGRSNRGAETLRVFAGVTRAGTTNERPSPASTSRAGHCLPAGLMPKPPECGGDEPSTRGHRNPLRQPSSPAGVLVRERDAFF